MIQVIASVSLKPQMKDTYLAGLKTVLKDIRAEEGCISYEVFEDLDIGLGAQRQTSPDKVTIVEQWRDKDCLQAHLQAAHMAEYREKVKDALESVELQVLQPVF